MCGCLRELSANKNDFNGKEKMYKACPLGWAKGGGQMLVYMAVTPDKYELPMAIFENWKEASAYANKSHETFKCAVSKQTVDRKNKCRYVSVRIDTKGEDNEREDEELQTI